MMKLNSYQITDFIKYNESLKKEKDSLNRENVISEEDSAIYGFENSSNVPIRSYENEVPEQDTLIIQQFFTPTVKQQPIDAWQTFLLILSVLLLGLAKAFSANRFKQTYRSLFNYRVAQEVCNEEKVFFHRVNILLTFNYVIIAALFIYQLRDLLNNINEETTSWVLYLYIFGFLLITNAIKFIFAHLLSFIFDASHLVMDYIFNVTLFNNLLSVLLIPILSLMFYTGLNFSIILTYIAFPVLIFCFVLRVFRLFVIGSSKGILYSYIFLYICTLEILPLVVMIKIFILK